MGQVLIRNLDDAVIADFKRAAVRNGRSLEAELREALAAARPRTQLTTEEKLALIDKLHARTPPAARLIDSTPLIREDRDTR
ncbi:FitA-like ribbon-helix-helix domain-containing protein [Sphingomonas sp. RS2018]